MITIQIQNIFLKILLIKKMTKTAVQKYENLKIKKSS